MAEKCFSLVLQVEYQDDKTLGSQEDRMLKRSRHCE